MVLFATTATLGYSRSRRAGGAALGSTTVSTTTQRPPDWFRVLAVLTLLWMLFGVMALAMDWTADAADVAQMSAAQQELRAERPPWLFAVYAVATLGGLAGAIGLLLRRRWAVALLALSLAAVVVQFGYVLLVMDAIRLLGAAAALTFPLVIATLGVLFLWFSVAARRRGWLR
jgi:hypothetical protein